MSIISASTESRDGTTIAYDVRGEGPGLVLVPAAMQFRTAEYSSAQFADELASSFTVLTYDRRGRGESGNTLPYAVEREIEDLEAMIGVLGGEASALGGSSGAVLALRAAAAGAPITRLAMYEPPFIIDASRPPLPADYVAHLEDLSAEGRPEACVEYFLTAALRLPSEMVARMHDYPMWPGMVSVGHTLAYDGRIMGDTMNGDPRALDVFASVQTPTLVISGGNSPAFMGTGARTLAEVLPTGEYALLPDQDHSADPRKLAEVVAPFLELARPLDRSLYRVVR